MLGRRPLTGERDARSEDRQLLLDALLAATEHVVITYTGANEHSGARRPPAVPLGEILDAADRTTAAPVRQRILTRHPLQSYDARNFKQGDPGRDPAEWRDGELGGPARRPFSFDGAALAGARGDLGAAPPAAATPARAAPRATAARTSRSPTSRRSSSTPCGPSCAGASTCRRRSSPTSWPTRSRSTLDALEKWQVGDHLLREVLAGQDPVAVMTAEQLRGTLPPGGLGAARAARRDRGVPAALGAHRRPA